MGAQSGDPNWSTISWEEKQNAKGEADETHFPTSVIACHRELWESASDFDSALRISRNESVREYVGFFRF